MNVVLKCRRFFVRKRQQRPRPQVFDKILPFLNLVYTASSMRPCLGIVRLIHILVVVERTREKREGLMDFTTIFRIYQLARFSVPSDNSREIHPTALRTPEST